ncbi:GumC family protein [Eilatimonas milleporae]|uniref:Uncharacterized protein involved in exopolysaccharide biosynthesis n=1 Tax=Eilatimonas milleporae TaxID=911205 RepID=A0A3M0CRZ0_9PROT|nr:hypothetical protein [Eilatimonas milleporae]RMB12282.1 uncharacterized protein involved in exopolysaccharide biosynthesis [Eilatimonas milleporae]
MTTGHHTDQTPPQDGIGHPGMWQVRDFVEEAETEGAPVNPVKMVLRVFRGLWLITIALGAVAGCLLAVAAFNAVKPKFESQGLVRVVAKEPKILYADNDDSRLRLYDAFVSAEATYIQSRPVLERGFDYLVDDMEQQTGSRPDLSFKDYAQSLAVKKQKGLIAITAASTDPAMAQRAVNALLKSYTDLHTQQSGTRQTMRARELEVRVQELSAKLFALNEELLQVGEEYDATSLSKAHLTKVTQLEELDLRIAELTNSLMEMEASNGALDADTGDMEIKRATLLDRAMADMVFERAKRAAELEKLLLRYQPGHDKVATLAASLQVIDDAIESRRRLIATLGKTGAITGTDGAAKSQSMAELEALKRKLSTRRRDLSGDARDLNSKLIQLKRINEEKSQVSGMLAETRRILDQVRLESRNSLPGTIEILSRGSLPDRPASDKRMQFALLGLMAGGGLVVAAVFLWRQVTGRIRFSDDIEGLLPPRTHTFVLPRQAGDDDFARYLGDLQLSDHWRGHGPTVISFVRFSDDCALPLLPVAELAARQGLKTLVVCGAEDGAGSAPGFIESIRGDATVAPMRAGGVDYMPFGTAGTGAGYTVDTARRWLDAWGPRYDLVLIYAGMAERHISARILTKLSHLTVTAVTPGDETRAVQRTISQALAVAPLFVGAVKGDPGLRQADPATHPQEGDIHDQAA